MATVQSTISFIEDHGHFAAVTPEGVIATSLACFCESPCGDDDRWFEETIVFPIIDGNVSTRAVREWLGY